MGALIRRVCYRIRGLFDDAAFAFVSTLVMAVGIGAGAVIFSIANAVLLRQLPYPKAERIVEVKQINPNGRRPNLCDAQFDPETESEYE